MNLLARVEMQPLVSKLINYVQILYDLIVHSQVVHNRGHGILKRLNPAGVYCFSHRYRPARLFSSLPGKAGKWARLNLYLA